MPKPFARFCRDNTVLLISLALLLVLLALPYGLLDLGLHNPYMLWHAWFWKAAEVPSPLPLDRLAYERLPLQQGQWWRLLTAHLVHLNINHALMNSAGLALLGYYFRRDFSAASWLGLMVVSALVISVGLYVFQPWLMGYAGLSGILHALLYAGLIVTWREMPRITSVVLALMVGRLFWEHSGAYNPDYLQGVIHGRVIPAAHLYGAITGTLWGLVTVWRQRRASAAEPSR